MPEELVTEPAETVDEESQASSRHHSCAISCADRDTTEASVEEIDVETSEDDEQSPPPVDAACRVDRE